MRRLQRIILLSLPLLFVCNFCAPGQAEVQRLPITENQIQKLIQQLGSQDYGTRKAAQGELQRLGHQVIDQLLIAQHDESSEVRLAARELLVRLPIRWTEGNPSIVDDITRNYFRRSTSEKSAYAKWLVRLEDGIGLAALVQIVRYEPSLSVAKEAALFVLEDLDREDRKQVAAFQNAVGKLKGSPRAPARWLEAFAANLSGEEISPSVWAKFAEQESELKSTSRYNERTISALYQHSADLAIKQNKPDQVREAVAKLVELQKKNEYQILQTSFWLIEKEQYEIFRELVWNKFAELQKKVPLFAYCDFMAKKKEGREKEAKLAADFAFEMTEDDLDFSNPFERAGLRLQAARGLEQREFVEQAIREYQRLMALENWRMIGMQEDVASYLSELLHDRQREKEAAETLETFLNTLEKDQGIDRSDLSTTVSRMHYFWSEHHRQNGDREKQKASLEKAVAAYESDADVLIAMHRLVRADAKWKAKTSKLIATAVANYETRIQQMRASGEFEQRERISTLLNQVAWLVGNTEGDFEKAVQNSRRSLELRPHSAGSLDTLGRCYFAAGDLDNALNYQRRAVRLQPYAKQIVRQLNEFEKAKSKSQ